MTKKKLVIIHFPYFTEETKTLVKQWNDVMQTLDVRLDEFERTLNTRLSNSIPRDVHSLEHMVIQHKDFETSLKVYFVC